MSFLLGSAQGGHPAVHEARHGPPGQRVGRGRRREARQVPDQADRDAAQGVPLLGGRPGGHQVPPGAGGAALPPRAGL